ncbi:flagellar basal body rod protein FlgB [Mariprofundus ferrooxydans]|uniref:Flagellar basal body rod protein FlgB n=1 Tax=Mariprofundus ferrooxydans PV-1 TaxID=314345 RepID=Q0EZK6_9PROT|nr:flagellar basal body rod protein FlgB [Mariprofundus ferrooxydans]EAU54698.1 Flagellar basal-body rod protein FlgB [Mariprofundus ferrooxydans PV-1]KON46746.1 flagellar biosynthesis protein FlgB [Mariprofundus ferrooxydans]
MDMLGSGFQKLESALIAREKVQGVLASNIANADTPNFHADKRSFSDFLSELQTGKSIGAATTTNPMHISDTNEPGLSGSILGQQPSASMDGNNVDMQQQMASMSENQLMYELTMRLIKGDLSSLANTIKEGSR